MSELIHVHAAQVQDPRGVAHQAFVVGEERADGTWVGWLEFRPEDGGADVLRTERETSQPNRAALVYWANGLEPVYLEGAFARAARA